jgi:hypothetical protein
MFVNRSGQNEHYLGRTFHRCFLPSFTSLGWGVSEENIKMWKVSVEEKMSRKGRESSAIQSQTVAYMKPLFRNLKHKVSLMYNITNCYHDTEPFYAFNIN